MQTPDADIIYPIAEIFDSIQGEGAHAGRKMRFLRLAGCSVGKPYTERERTAGGLMVFQDRCQSWNGASFACDTDYRVKDRMSLAATIEAMGRVEWVALTGGEPLMHRISPLIRGLLTAGHKVHVETSGTILLGDWVRHSDCWVTVSPKANYDVKTLWEAHAVKVLIERATFDEGVFLKRFESFKDKLWLQPVNGLHEASCENTQLCVDLVMRYPQMRLSTQVHKAVHVR